MNQSVSTVALFKNCPLAYKLHTIVGLRKIEDESADHHLRFGSAWHKAMEVIYSAQRATMELYRIVGNRFIGRDTMRRVILSQAKEAFLAAYPKQLDESDNAKTQESAFAALESYYDLYAEDDRARWKVLAVEAPESYDNGFIVHLDMVAEDLEHGGVYGFDFKTTKKPLSGQSSSQFWSRFEPSSQITRYVDYIRDRYGSCEGFYIRATSFTYSSKNTKLGPAGFRINHEAQLFNVNDAQIQIEKESANYWQAVIMDAVVNDSFGTNTDHCPFCQFKPICRSGWRWPEDQDLILNQYRVTCGQMTESLRPCLLDVDHGGKHSEERPTVTDDLNIEVDV